MMAFASFLRDQKPLVVLGGSLKDLPKLGSGYKRWDILCHNMIFLLWHTLPSKETQLLN
jgi:hypothetical protein